MSAYLSFKRFSIIRYAQVVLSLMIVLAGIQDLSAQCPQSLGCNDDIQISLDYECYAVITPELLLEDERDGCDYTVTILTAGDVVLAQTSYDMMGNPLHPVIDGSYIGTPYKASVSFLDDNGTTISCWGWFTVEDKLPPELTCIEDITVDCSKDLSGLYTSMGLLTYCTDMSPVDMDADPGTITLALTPLTDLGTTMPWEMIDFLDINVPLNPFTGSGSGMIISDGGAWQFNVDPVDNSIYTGEIRGVQATDQNLSPTMSVVIRDTPANQAAIAQGFCIDFNTVSFYKYQQEDNCDPDVEVIINKDEIHSLECTTGDFTARRDIEYYTRDHVGLSAEVCAFSIYFEKKSILDLVFPDNVFYDCDDPYINTDGELDLSPEKTGQPTIDGFPLDDADNLCRINVTFMDDTFSVCGINTIKILRRWTALDWCEGTYAQSYQTIKVVDEDGPEIECPDDGLVFEIGHDCVGDVVFRPFDENDPTGFKSIFDCANLSVEVWFLRSDDYNPLLIDQVFTKAVEISDNVWRASDLQNGLNYIRYIVTDECGNESRCEFEIFVEDNNPPFAVCDQFTAVSLADNGWGRVYAISVDDGSYDECGGPVVLDIRRESTACDSLPEYEPSDLEYGDYVQFCCQEAGQTIPVIMRVTDQGGKSNTCIVNVIVQDKTGVDVEYCPQSYYRFYCDDLTSIHPDSTGYPVINGDCGVGEIRYEDSGTLNDICGNGTIIRKWFVDLPNNTVELTSCEQEFYFTSDVILTEDSFTWPADREDASCDNYHTDLGDAVLYNDVPVNEAPVCAHLSYAFSDRVFHNVEGFCVKIIRTWTVIDFCIYDPVLNPYEGKWTRTQVVKVASDVGPSLTDCPQDVVYDAPGNGCEQIINFDPPRAFDDCSKEYLHPSQIDYTISLNGDIVLSGSGPIVNEVLNAGTYVITWYAEGVCSTISSCSHTVQVIDNKAPVPYCRAGVTTALMPPIDQNSEPYIEIWASDFDLGSYDNCDPSVELSFDQFDLSIKSIGFDCDDIGANTVTMWVTDDMGNQDFCTTLINIQANGGICPDTSNMMIAGHVETEFNEMIENVEVSLQTMVDQSMSYEMTNFNGEFAFENIGAYGDYQLRVNSADDYLNGVSTLDLIMIQRHILGLEYLDSPYQLIASDINSSRDITAVDLIELRKLILGIHSELPSNDSWRFVDKSFKFVDLNNPWPFKESIDLYDLNRNDMSNDFIAVKIGDVNGSVELNDYSNKRIIRSFDTEDLYLSHDILKLDSDEDYLIPFYMEEDESIMGIQLFMSYEKEYFEIVGLESGRLRMDKDNYNITDDQIALVWHQEKAIHSEAEDALFYLVVRSSNELNSDIFDLAESKINSEAYDQNFDVRNIKINRRENSFENKLFQNTPNPFSGLTTIDFELSSDSEIRMSIYDTNGKQVKVFKGHYRKGLNSIILSYDELNGNGIYYYQLETGSFSATRKMILIE